MAFLWKLGRSTLNYSKLRIRCRDENNWVIEGYQEGGDLISRGKFAGQAKKAKWDETNPIGYFSQLKFAAQRLLDEELRAILPQNGWTGEDLSQAIQQAEKRVLLAVEKAIDGFEKENS